MNIEQWPLERLREYAKNPRKNDHAIDSMAEAIKAFGFRVPILARSSGEIVDGHLRYKAAKKLALETVPIILADDMTDAQIKAFRLSVNKAAEWAQWDFELLKVELGELKALDFDITPIGFDTSELFDIMRDKTGHADPEATPEPPENPVSRIGDLWVLGAHRLLCGDATNAEDVARLLGTAKPHLMVVDPPWGVEYDPSWRQHSGISGPGTAKGIVYNDDRPDWREAWKLFKGDVAYTWSPAGTTQIEHYNSLVAAGFEIRMQIIWAKSHFPIGRGDYHVQHEPCWYAVRKGKTGHWEGDRSQSTLWQIDKPHKSETGHSTQKPIECMKRPMENNSKFGDAVYDPFVGSGTSIIAAEMIGRRCYSLEIHPPYVDVCIERWEKFTTHEAIHADTGKTFSETKKERAEARSVDEVESQAAR